MTRTCNACGQTLDLETGFHRRTHRGRPGFQHRCKWCAGAHSRRQQAARRAARGDGPLVPRRLAHQGVVLLAMTCPACHRLLDASGYHRSRRRALGVEPTCRACRATALTPTQREDGVRRAAKSRARAGRAADAARRARKLGAPVEPFTRADLWASYAERDLYRCAYCAGPYEHDDHVLPLARGGAHAVGNLVPACAPCNMQKHTRTPAEWLPHRY